jgi:hypothetical protein
VSFRYTHIAGDPAGGYGSTDAADPFTARFNAPQDCALSLDRTRLYVADFGNDSLRVVTLSGTFPVTTLATVVGPVKIEVGPVTGNIWVYGQGGGHNYVYKVTPAGVVTLLHDGAPGSDLNFEPLPDAEEVYGRVKHMDSTGFYQNWQWHLLADWSETGVVSGSDGAYASWTGQFRSTKYPHVVVYNKDNTPTIAVHRDSPPHPEAAFHAEYGWNIYTNKLVAGPDVGPHESLFCIHNGTHELCSFLFDSNPAAPWFDATVTRFNLPAVPAYTLARDPVTGTMFVPTNNRVGYANEAGSANGIPMNGVVVITPDSALAGNYIPGGGP